MIIVNHTFKPRRLSKKKKAKLAQEEAAAKETRKIRDSYWRTAPTLVHERPFVADRNQGLSINDAPGLSPIKPPPTVEIDDDMISREKKAKEHSDRLKKQVAPLYSKGPYQYIGDDPEIIKNLGKKV